MDLLNEKHFNKERVKSRLIKKALELWGHPQSDIDSFDPLVKLLFEAFSGEIEKIANEIHNTQDRILERLVNLINPDADITRPAYSVIKARPIEPSVLITRDYQFLFKKGNQGRNGSGGDNGEFFFSPVEPQYLFNAEIKYLVHDNTIFQMENGMLKIPVASAQSKNIEEGKSLWIGLQLDKSIESFKGFAFYFDWLKQPHKENLFQHLPLSDWSIENHPITIRPGFDNEESQEENVALDDVFDTSSKLEKQIKGIVSKHFITISSSPDFKEINYKSQKYPVSFEKFYSKNDLKNLKDELYWVKIVFPGSLASDAIANIFCSINSFPAVNRKLHKQTYKVQQSLNVIPLQTNDSFFGMKEVYNSRNIRYKSIPLAGINDLEVQNYTFRYGINRMDQRSARELLSYVLDALQDESSAFAGLGEDFLTTQIHELNQNIARIEQRLSRANEVGRSSPFLIIKNNDAGEYIYLEYWSTKGQSGNNIAAGNKLSLYSGSDINKNEIYFITTSSGGKEKPKSEEKINLLKKTLLTRNRIVTVEDIRSTVKAELGNSVRQISVRKGFENGPTPNTGFMRNIRVEISPSEQADLSHDEWTRVCGELKYMLESNSTMQLPYHIVAVF